MKTNARIEEILEAGLSSARYKAYLPWNKQKDDTADTGLFILNMQLRNEVDELNEAIEKLTTLLATGDIVTNRRPIIEDIVKEVGDVVYSASMIADRIRNMKP